MTDEQVMAMDDALFMQTQAFRAFGTKQLFIQKIHDQVVRLSMLKLPQN